MTADCEGNWFVNLLEIGDSIMADKVFTIVDLLYPLGVTLNKPPMRDSNRQLSRQEVEQTRRIAAVRIHVERNFVLLLLTLSHHL